MPSEKNEEAADDENVFLQSYLSYPIIILQKESNNK
jgi:hypothetical protein